MTSVQIMTIPRLSKRLECMLYRRKLELDIEEVRPEINIVRNASYELRSSVRFKKVLQVKVFHDLSHSPYSVFIRLFWL